MRMEAISSWRGRAGTVAMIVIEARRSRKRPLGAVTRGPMCRAQASRTRRTTLHGTGIIAPMSERGLPTEGAPACPFVAFEDDRDGRSTAPDHRHRCFAEPRPAPRALAHQEAYCLSSAFAVCPTFQDWARREAAAARPVPASESAPHEDAAGSRPAPPPARAPSGPQAGTFPPPRRSAQRDWAAPPPWVGDRPDGRPSAGAASAGAAAAGASVAAAGASAAGASVAAAGGAAAGAPVAAANAWSSESGGLAGSPADRLAGPDPDEPRSATPGDPDRHDDDLDDPWPSGASAAGAGAYVAGSATARPSTVSRAAPPPRRAAPARRSSVDQASKPVGQDPSELFGPAWERPRRYEAYPTLRTRMGLPALGGIPKVAVWALILMLAALLVFLFGPSLLGFGTDESGGVGATPTPAATEQVTPEPEPTAPPAPTQQVHVVVKGDTMSKIAKKYGVTVEELMAANPQIKNQNKIAIGDAITIPVPVEEDVSAGGDGTVDGELPVP